MSKNGIASALRSIALIIYVVGFIAGFALGNVTSPLNSYFKEFSSTLALFYWISAFISGTVFLGFSEIIDLLQKLVDKDTGIKTNLIADKSEKFTDLPRL